MSESYVLDDQDSFNNLEISEHLKLTDELIKIFKLVPLQRTESDILLLYNYIISNNSIRNEALFRLLSYDAIKTLCTTSLQYQSYKNGSIVFLQSEISNAAYILLNGCMSIWITKNEPPKAIPEDLGSNNKILPEDEENRIAFLTSSHDDRLGECIGIIKAGSERSSFGEMGLIEGTNRSATIRSEGLTACIRIDKDAFDACIKLQLQAEFNNKIKVLRSFQIFRWLSEASLKRIALNFKSSVFSPHTVLYKSGQKVDWLHFISAGECGMSIDLSCMSAIDGKFSASRKSAVLSSVLAGQFVGVESVRTINAYRHYEHQARLLQTPAHKLIADVANREKLNIPSAGIASQLINPIVAKNDKFEKNKKTNYANFLLHLTCTTSSKVNALSIRLTDLLENLGNNSIDKAAADIEVLENLREERINRIIETEISYKINAAANSLKLNIGDTSNRRKSGSTAFLSKVVNSINESEEKNRRKSANLTKDILSELEASKYSISSSPESDESLRRKTAGAAFLSSLISTSSAPNSSKLEDVVHHDGLRKAPNAATLSHLINSAKNLPIASAPVTSRPSLTPLSKTDISTVVRDVIDMELRKSANFESSIISPNSKPVSNQSLFFNSSKSPNYYSIDSIIKTKAPNQVKFNADLKLHFAPTLVDTDKKQSSMGISPGPISSTSNSNFIRSPAPIISQKSPNTSPPPRKGNFLSSPVTVSQNASIAINSHSLFKAEIDVRKGFVESKSPPTLNPYSNTRVPITWTKFN